MATCHSTMDRPDRVRRTHPPETTMTATGALSANSHHAIALL